MGTSNCISKESVVLPISESMRGFHWIKFFVLSLLEACLLGVDDLSRMGYRMSSPIYPLEIPDEFKFYSNTELVSDVTWPEEDVRLDVMSSV